jgi:hypothetical protein
LLTAAATRLAALLAATATWLAATALLLTLALLAFTLLSFAICLLASLLSRSARFTGFVRLAFCFHSSFLSITDFCTGLSALCDEILVLL